MLRDYFLQSQDAEYLTGIQIMFQELKSEVLHATWRNV